MKYVLGLLFLLPKPKCNGQLWNTPITDSSAGSSPLINSLSNAIRKEVASSYYNEIALQSLYAKAMQIISGNLLQKALADMMAKPPSYQMGEASGYPTSETNLMGSSSGQETFGLGPMQSVQNQQVSSTTPNLVPTPLNNMPAQSGLSAALQKATLDPRFRLNDQIFENPGMKGTSENGVDAKNEQLLRFLKDQSYSGSNQSNLINNLNSLLLNQMESQHQSPIIPKSMTNQQITRNFPSQITQSLLPSSAVPSPQTYGSGSNGFSLQNLGNFPFLPSQSQQYPGLNQQLGLNQIGNPMLQTLMGLRQQGVPAAAANSFFHNPFLPFSSIPGASQPLHQGLRFGSPNETRTPFL